MKGGKPKKMPVSMGKGMKGGKAKSAMAAKSKAPAKGMKRGDQGG